MGRHFKGSQFKQAKLQAVALGREKLIDAEFGAMRVSGDIDEQIAKQSIEDERWALTCGELAEGYFKLI
jgi:hypothetical protein